MNYKLVLSICALSLLAGCQQSSDPNNKMVGNVTPPKYLSIDGFKNCLSTKNYGSWQGWCLPSAKPTTCSESSWHKLTRLQGKDAVPSC